jgi:hypothetical protein
MKQSFLALAAVAILPGCEVFEALVNGLAALKAQPQFAFVRSEPIIGGNGVDTTVVVTPGTVTRPGEAYLFAPVRPKGDSYTEPRRVMWNADGTRLAVSLQELFFGGFDDWIFVYDRNLHQRFFGSDDTMGTAMAAGCAPIDAPALQAAADQLVSEGAIPPGSVAKFRPGTGIIQGATLIGWQDADRFVMTLFHEPEAFAEAPDGTEHDLSVITGIPTLGEFVTLAASFSETGGSWIAGDCSLTVPAVPARVPAGPVVTLGAAGAVLGDGAALIDQHGAAISGAAAADGSY